MVIGRRGTTLISHDGTCEPTFFSEPYPLRENRHMVGYPIDVWTIVTGAWLGVWMLVSIACTRH